MTATTGTIYVPDVGAIASLLDIFQLGNDWTLRLFVNDVTPADGDTAATYTEAAGGGYAPKSLAGQNWSVALVAGVATATYAEQVFTLTGALTGDAVVRGWFATDASGELRCACRQVISWQPTAAGGTWRVSPIYQLSKGTTS